MLDITHKTMNKRNRLRDSFTVIATSTSKSANGDLVPSVTSETTYRCRVESKNQMMVEKNIDVSQREFDYSILCRAETIQLAQLDDFALVRTSKTGDIVFQVIDIDEETLRTTRVTLKATSK